MRDDMHPLSRVMGAPLHIRTMLRRMSFRWGVSVVLALTHFFLSPIAAAEPNISAPVGARDVSHEWRAFLGDGDLDAARVEAAYGTVLNELRGYKVVIVPSYLSDLLIDADEHSLTDYIGAQMAALEADGIEVDIAPVDTEESVAENGRRLAAYIALSKRPVCIISHSKGGLDTLEFLLRAAPEYRRQVVCWVVFQSPFAGSPVADMVVEEGWTRTVTDPLLRALGGSEQSLDDLTVAVRSKYMSKNAKLIESIGKSTPIIVVASYVNGTRSPSLHFAPTFHWLKDQGFENDGLVTIDSALLPGARFIVLPGFDHTDTVAGKPLKGSPVDRVLLWKSLLYLALSDRPT